MSLCFPVNGEKVHLEEVLSRKQGIYQPFHPHYSTRPPYKSLKFPGSQRNPPEIRGEVLPSLLRSAPQLPPDLE